jgi:hypothetical protein
MRKGYLGGLEDGVGHWGQLGQVSVFRLPSAIVDLQRGHP